MKAMLAGFITILALQITPAFAASKAKSPLVGHWTLDVSTLPMPPEARPKSVNLDFSDADSKWATHVEIIDQSNNRLYSESTLSLDGTPGRASGTYWVDVVAAKMPSPDVLVMQCVYKGVPSSTRIFSVSADGKVLTETEAYFKEGTPMMRTAFYTRMIGK